MNSIDTIIYGVGLVTTVAGTFGIVALIVGASIDSVLKLTGFNVALLQAYARLQTEKMHERQAKGGAA